MQLGMVGLGRMGAHMTQRLLDGGHEVVVYDHNPAAVEEATARGAIGATSLEELAGRLRSPRAIWMMVPAGPAVAETIAGLMPHLAAGDTLVDGGNSHYQESIQRAGEAAAKGIGYLDAGTSGGVWGQEVGYCLMVGGTPEAFARLEPAIRTLAPPEGYARVGPSGAGHFAKMVHNGIEYGMLQAYGEGFEILHASSFGYDLEKLCHLWGRGSVVRSWLLELAEHAFSREADLASIKGYVADSGEGRWTVQAAIDENVPAPVITLSLLARLASRQEESFSARVIAALRREFGGHAVEKQ
ncbi:MAG: decarboxylating 6-phosphogluconate dehydrogenase [Chthonomonadales bacterium]|nr:decarboxylating 6-phosphogluconate dehydrogenase [Chthonomonadales bacterium]